MWIREGHGGTRNLSQSGSNEQGEDQKFIQTFFPAQSRWSPKKKSLHWNSEGFSGRNHKFNHFSGRKRVISKKTPIWASICSPMAPSLLISSGHSPRLRGAQFLFGGGTSSHLGGTVPECPPWRRVWTLIILQERLGSLYQWYPNFWRYGDCEEVDHYLRSPTINFWNKSKTTNSLRSS